MKAGSLYRAMTPGRRTTILRDLLMCRSCACRSSRSVSKRYRVPDAKLLNQLKADALDDLSSGHEKAIQELLELEDAAVYTVQQGLFAEAPSDFVRRQFERILQTRQDGIPVYPSPERLALRRSLLVLELIGNAEGRAVLKSVADGNPKDPWRARRRRRWNGWCGANDPVFSRCNPV